MFMHYDPFLGERLNMFSHGFERCFCETTLLSLLCAPVCVWDGVLPLTVLTEMKLVAVTEAKKLSQAAMVAEG